MAIGWVVEGASRPLAVVGIALIMSGCVSSEGGAREIASFGAEGSFRQFGVAVAATEEVYVVGAPSAEVNESASGAAFLYSRAHELLRTLAPPEPQSGMSFGFAVALCDELVAVGAPEYRGPGSGSATGAVFLFRRSDGSLYRTLTDQTPSTRDEFGATLACHEVSGVLAVGAPTHQRDGKPVGEVQVFDVRSGEHIATIDDPTPSNNDLFGMAITFNDALIAVGAPADSSLPAQTGQVHVFSLPDWSLVRTIDDPTPSRFDLFGDSVALTERYLAVGAPRHGDKVATKGGEVHLFAVDSFELLWTQTPSVSHNNAWFGRPVHIVDDRVMVGAIGQVPGRVHVLALRDGVLLQEITDPNATEDDQFGIAFVGIGRTLIIGSPGDDERGRDSGEVVVVRLN